MVIQDYKPLYSKSKNEIQGDIRELQAKLDAYNRELANRVEGDTFEWGFNKNGTLTSWETFDEAVEAAVEFFKDPDAGYQVHKIYDLKS